VAAIGLGCMPLSISGRPPESEAIRVIHAALGAGMTLLDTADVYCMDERDIGHNERLIAKALQTWPHGDELVVATKGGMERPGGDWTCNGSPAHLARACDASLKALGLDCITLYQLHTPDDDVPFAESVGALAQLRAAGKIRHVGLSNVSVAEIEVARAIVPIVSVQNRCNPFDLSSFSDGVVGACEAAGIAFLPYSPVGGGRGKDRVRDDATLQGIARKHRVTPFQVTLAWLLACSPVMVPIPGASRLQSARDSAKAMDLVLDADDMALLRRAFPT
jgi:aryl-alcohol dehydrogenase-like predicted oxidoreductase